MRKILVLGLLGAILVTTSVPAVGGDLHVRGCTPRDGTCVQLASSISSAKGGGSGGRGGKGGTVNVRPYIKKDGTVVMPHHRTAPNDSKMDNWSTKGNVNPYTGKEGTKDPIMGR